MGEVSKRKGGSEESIDVPSEVLTPDKQLVDTSGDVWEVKTRSESTSVVRLRVTSALRPITDQSTRSMDLIRLYLAERLRSVKPNTVQGDLEAFRSLLKWWSEYKTFALEWGRISESDWRAFLDYCMESTSRRGGIFSAVRAFYRWGAFQKEFRDFDKGVASSISQIRASGNEQGEAVRTLDPIRGPLSDAEIKLINDALDDRVGTLRQRVIVRLLLELGLRPLALSIIKGKHLSVYDVPVAEKGEADAQRLYQLKVPKLKSRSAQISTWFRRPLSTDLGRELEEVSQSEEELLLHWLSAYKSPSNKIGNELQAWVEEADIISPRTGDRLTLFPRRFRRTLATDMAVQGASRAQIAQALGHSDLQNVGVYMDASSAILERMKEKDAFEFQDEVVDLFMGEISDPSDENISDQRIPGAAPQAGEPSDITGNIGACQKSSACSLTPPLSCYTCKHFAAFKDAPHADIKSQLEGWIQDTPDGVDRRVPQQYVTTIKAIRQLLKQLEDE